MAKKKLQEGRTREMDNTQKHVICLLGCMRHFLEGTRGVGSCVGPTFLWRPFGLERKVETRSD